MKRDTVKTIAGLIIIVGIVVATFMYGNAQRQKQLAHDQEVKQQQEAAARDQAKSVSPSVTASTGTSGKTATPTATPKATATPKVTATPAATSTPGTVAGANTTVPVTGGTGAALPETGPETAGMLGLGAIGVMAMAVRRSRQAMLSAARTRR